MDLTVLAAAALFAGGLVIWARPAAHRKRRLADRVTQTRCAYAVSNDERGCYRTQVNAAARQAGQRIDIGACANCRNGSPRWLTRADIEKHAQRVEEGWITATGELCSREVYSEALVRGMTPAQLARRKAISRFQTDPLPNGPER